MKHYYGAIKCPFCHATHYVLAGQTSAFPPPDTPIRRCHKCQRTFLCLDYREPALLVYTSPERIIQEPKVYGFVLVGLFCLAVALLRRAESSVFFISLAIGVVLFIVAIIVKLNSSRIKRKIENSRKERELKIEEYLSGPSVSELDKQSLIRLSNPDYIRYLELVGVSVPAWFKDRIDYEKYLSEVDDNQFAERIIKLNYPNARQYAINIATMHHCSLCGNWFSKDSNKCPKCGTIIER